MNCFPLVLSIIRFFTQGRNRRANGDPGKSDTLTSRWRRCNRPGKHWNRKNISIWDSNSPDDKG